MSDRLEIAVYEGNADLVADILLSGNFERSVMPLVIAARRGRTNILRLLVEEKVCYPAELGEPLAVAIERNNFDIVKFIVEESQISQPALGRPLAIAAAKGRLPIIKYLLSRGADPRSSGDWPLGAAVCAGQIAVVRYLMSFYDREVVGDRHLLKRLAGDAAASGQRAVVRFFIDELGIGHEEALLGAARYGHLGIAEDIVQVAGRMVRNSLPEAYFMAIRSGNHEVAEYLRMNQPREFTYPSYSKGVPV